VKRVARLKVNEHIARTMTAHQHREPRLLRLREYSIITMGMSDVGVLYTAKNGGFDDEIRDNLDL
jgi:hypothetical protein